MEHAWFDIDGRQVYRPVKDYVPKRSTVVPLPHFISDTMEPTEHPCTGKLMTSKTEFRAVTKAHDCTEVGNDPARFKRTPPKRDPKANREALQRAEQMIRNGDVKKWTS